MVSYHIYASDNFVGPYKLYASLPTVEEADAYADTLQNQFIDDGKTFTIIVVVLPSEVKAPNTVENIFYFEEECNA